MTSSPEGLWPVVRHLEPVPFDHKGARYIHLRDPLHFSDSSLSVSLPAYFLITLMDGTRTVEGIQAEFNHQFNASIPLREVQGLVRDLDGNFLLANDKFETHRKRVINDFVAEPMRRSSLAGNSYPAEPGLLSILLDGFLAPFPAPETAPFAIIAPHIDLRAGGPTFGAAFSRLRSSTAETFIILAIGHALEGDFFACIDKDFETPLGVSPVDRSFLARLERDFGEPVCRQMYAHKHEHSAEFQVLFLQEVFRSAPPKKIVPILFSFPEMIEELRHPVYNIKRIRKFIDALQRGLDRQEGKACLIAGVDLSHIGQRFGQAEGVDDQRLGETAAVDRRLLQDVAEGNKDDFMELMKEVNPRNNVCGFPALYFLMDLLKGRKGTLLDYRQNIETDTSSMVSFAAMEFR